MIHMLKNDPADIKIKSFFIQYYQEIP